MVYGGTAPAEQDRAENGESANREIRLDDARRARGFFSHAPAWTQQAVAMVGAGIPDCGARATASRATGLRRPSASTVVPLYCGRSENRDWLENGVGSDPKRIEGGLVADGLRFAIVASRWNEFIVGRLIEGALDGIVRHGGSLDNITVVRVPGSFESALAAKKVAKAGQVDAVICLGAVIRGETPHFDHVAGEAFKGINHVSLDTELPIAVGIVTADSLDQAINRAGGKSGNKGYEAAVTAIEMANLLRAIG